MGGPADGQGPADDPAAERYRVALAALRGECGVDAEARFVEVDAPVERLHYLDAGAGEPVLLLHGLGGAAVDWVPLLADLRDHRLLALEWPGHGLSDPLGYAGVDVRAVTEALLSAFLDALGLETATVVGNSYGGFHAAVFASRAPERVDRLCLVGAPAGIGRAVPIPVRLLGTRPVDRLLYRLTTPDSTREARQLYRRINVADDRGLSETFFECVRAAGQVPGRRKTLLSLLDATVGLRGARPALRIDEDLRRIDVPTRFVWGSEDYFHPPSVGRRVATDAADATFVEIGGAGHLPWLEPGDAASDAVAAFLEG